MLKSKEGTQVPSVTFPVRENDEWNSLSTDNLFANKKVIVFSLPGAFTPTCSSTHLPRYSEMFSKFKENGIDDILCVSVNDTFVMNAWKEQQGASEIRFIPDGTGEFSEKMGMLVDKSDIGFGKRSWRYSMLVSNGIIEKMFIEKDIPGDPFEVSDADTMMKYINPEYVDADEISIITKDGCQHCTNAKSLLVSSSLSFEEITLNQNITMKSVKAITGKNTVPQVFIGGNYIGGYESLKDLISKQ
jgi:glutaredoxin-like protein